MLDNDPLSSVVSQPCSVLPPSAVPLLAASSQTKSRRHYFLSPSLYRLNRFFSWRLCFWINLPFGVFAVAAIFFFVPVTVPSSVVQGDKRPWYRRLMSVDWIGTGLLLAAVTMLLLALQLGGNIKPWNSGEVIGVSDLPLASRFFSSHLLSGICRLCRPNHLDRHMGVVHWR